MSGLPTSTQSPDLGEAVIARHAIKSSLFLTPPPQPGLPGLAQESAGFIGQGDRKPTVSMNSFELPAVLKQSRGDVQRAPVSGQTPRQESKLPLPSRPVVENPEFSSAFNPGGAQPTYQASATAKNLPLAAIQRAPDSQAQSGAIEASIVNLVQRAQGADGDSDAAETPVLNLDELARMVYPLIKRILAVEQERLARRR